MVWSNAVNATQAGVQTINGGFWTGSTLTQYDVLVGGVNSAISSIGPGTQYQILQSGGASANPAYSTATYPAVTTLNALLYSSAANVVDQVPVVIDGVLVSNHATGLPYFLPNSGTAGWVLTANSGAPPSWQAVPSSGVSVLNWAVNSTASFALAAGSGILATYAGAIAVALPTSLAPIGSALGISVVNAAGVATITLGTGQTIQIGSQTFSTSVASQAQGDMLVLIDTVAASGSAGAWVATQVIGNWIGS